MHGFTSTGKTPLPTLIRGPQAEPVDVGDLRRWLRLGDSEDHDPEIEALVSAAREWLEDASGLTLGVTNWQLKFSRFPRVIELPGGPLVAASVAITYLDQDGASQTVDADTYEVITSTIPGEVRVAYWEVWPIPGYYHEAVTVAYQTGLPPARVPEKAKLAIKLLVSTWFTDRDGQRPIPEAAQHLAWSLGGHRF